MKRFGYAAVVFVSLLTAPSVHAIGRLSVELRNANKEVQARFGQKSGIVEVVLRNSGDQTIEVDEDSIPFMNREGTSFSAVLGVVGEDKKEPNYLGLIVEYVNGLRVLIIAPGNTVIRRIDILKNYKVEPGHTYIISMRPVRYLDRPRTLIKDTSSDNISALLKGADVTPIQFDVSPDADLDAIRKSRKPAMTGSPTASQPCDTGHLSYSTRRK